jgi:hypothetical protein
MTDRYAELDAALDRVAAAAREHLSAVKVAQGADDDAVWHAYVALNNASFSYDELLNDVFGEVTPWDLEQISPEEAEHRLNIVTSAEDDLPTDDPHPAVVSVRQRRDYRVPSVSRLLMAAELARGPQESDTPPVASVGEAIMELLQAGDGSMSMLDLPELDPLDGVLVVAEVGAGYDPQAHPEEDAAGPFQLGADDRQLARLDERPFVDEDELPN